MAPIQDLTEFEAGGYGVHRVVSSYYRQNAFVIRHGPTRTALVVDPGPGTEAGIQAVLERHGLRPDYILLTHEHHDHIADVTRLRRRYPCRLAASGLCSEAITQPKRNLSVFFDGVGFSVEPADLVLDGLDWFQDWPGGAVRILATPGHTDACLCFALGGVLFTGDTLILGEKTVVKLPGGSRDKLRRTLGHLFGSFPPETIVCPGHGPIFPLGATTEDVHAGPVR